MKLYLAGIVVFAIGWTSIAAYADELLLLNVNLSNGRTLRAALDSTTNSDRLWLRFGNARTSIRRGFDWQAVVTVRDGERVLDRNELVRIAESTRSPANNSARSNRIVIPPNGASPETAILGSPRHASVRIADVTFNVELGNWDGDVAADGLLIQIVPRDENGAPVAAHGTLNVELFATYRIDQDSAPHGRGSDVRALGSWSKPVELPMVPIERGIRLPFQASHPELDTDWAPVGLIHLQFVAAGQGVFHRSIDGFRIRPWGPFRDELERKSGERFLPIEK
jgi:hypothetical protein